MDFIERGTLSLKNLKCVVLDEVDRMLDMGFADSVDQILKTRYRTGYCRILSSKCGMLSNYLLFDPNLGIYRIVY